MMDAPFSANFVWLPLDTWIVLVAATAGMACALPGTFLVLRKMSMMGDAISHAVLPGLAAAFLITGSRASVSMLAGAAVVGVLTALLTEWIHTRGKVDESASMGVVFTFLFAVGLILLVRAADHVDLDPGCVLYGAIEATPLNRVEFLGLEIPQAALVVGAVLFLNLLFVITLYKELKISTFDPALATTLGIHARLMHYLLMTLVAVTTVAAFESVGSILVIAMLIVPAATAHLFCDRLWTLIVAACVFAVVSAVLGHLGAILVPGWLGYEGISTSTAGMMAVTAGLLFALALVSAPRHGLVSRVWVRTALALRIAREDVLGHLYRFEESAVQLAKVRAASDVELRRRLHAGSLLYRFVIWQLRRSGRVLRTSRGYRLTERGRETAAQLVRAHRLWETYFDSVAQLPHGHLHGPAEELEHFTDEFLGERLAESIGHPGRDPHGSPIPRRTEPRP
jgi:manganese/zinc/iron transport system permease protein